MNIKYIIGLLVILTFLVSGCVQQSYPPVEEEKTPTEIKKTYRISYVKEPGEKGKYPSADVSICASLFYEKYPDDGSVTSAGAGCKVVSYEYYYDETLKQQMVKSIECDCIVVGYVG